MTTPLEGPQGTTRLGHLLGPHGVQGGVKLYVLGDPAQVLALKRVYVQTRGWLNLRRAESAPPSVVLHLAGVTTREGAEQLRGLHVYAADAELPALEEGSFYYHDLRGLDVYGAGGEHLGNVSDVLDAGHQDLLVVDYGAGTSFVPLQAPYVEIALDGGKPSAVRLSADAPAGLIGPESAEDDSGAAES
ncbi:ribosome maturation factor RimM [Deinococcus wulumuqiensis]|uniref:Ribosome maturation factor RimM n=1 Tax=Deinococcus wulumuqiensis TaxID=980427 RepID=A0AAV4K921_9DEIO|nr:ribosome maturation factor RimM [Deinococcus wulumuqiensis]QII19534.1 16S rRNA processing protein RimM [Deinococcus wulumuqiensis R12]GGI88461.1 ribosome maturation factor RimM [Deinococcus wulumuqiensis]GGP30366.1 ribosome maturation factor RimM [Deinococcus wulumuqiensis]